MADLAVGLSAGAIGALALATVAAAAEVPPPERQQELLHRLRHDCGSCHGLTLKGGLGPALRPEDLAGRSAGELVDAILHGRPGTPMPPWDFEISEAEAIWLVRQLKDGLDDAS